MSLEVKIFFWTRKDLISGLGLLKVETFSIRGLKQFHVRLICLFELLNCLMVLKLVVCTPW